MIHHENFIDRLLLAQGNGDSVYIDDYEIPRTSIEGIRFLYKQFNLRKSGVILNEADRINRNTQVCLFIRAVRPLLSRPILILCQDGYEYCWLGRFDIWCRKLINEVTVETEDPFIKKKMVIINTMVNLHKFCTRQWSIIIVDGDTVTSPNPILMLPFKSCFKIWITEINMKENLDKFEEAYKWVFPREIFDKHFFIPKPGNAVDVVEKSILLDAFFEEIVVKRNDSTSREKHVPERRTGNTLFGPNRSSSMIVGNTTIRLAIPASKELPMVVGDTIITRTKVDPGLGSSRMIGDTTISSTSIASSTSAFKSLRETNITPNTDYVMSVCDTSITASNAASTAVTPTKPPVPTVIISKKNKDATGTKIKRSKPRIEPENVPTKIFESPMAVLAKLLEESPKTEPGEDGNNRIDYCIENFSKINGKDNGLEQSNMESIKDEIKAEKLIEITELAEKPNVEAQVAGDKLVEMDTLVFGHDTLISQVTDNLPGKGNNTATDKKETEPHTILTCKPVGERSTHNKLFTNNKKSTSPIAYKTSARCSENSERDEKNDRKKLKCKSLRSEEPDVIEIDLDELNREMRALVTRDRPERLAKRQKTDSSQTTTYFDESKNKFNGHNKETSISGNKLTEQIVNSLKRNNIDVQMKECEETVSKKFKGSLLDRLF